MDTTLNGNKALSFLIKDIVRLSRVHEVSHQYRQPGNGGMLLNSAPLGW
jgi:hypothetical protein